MHVNRNKFSNDEHDDIRNIIMQVNQLSQRSTQINRKTTGEISHTEQ